MTLINHLEGFQTANVELLCHRLAAADLEGTFTLKAIDECFAALHRTKPNIGQHTYTFALDLFTKRQSIPELDAAMDTYLATLQPQIFAN